MNRLFNLIRFGIAGLSALVFALVGRWVVLGMGGDGQSALLFFAFLFVGGGLLGFEIANRFAPAITDRLVRSMRRD
ncbi:MAG TPA: hypothetical protein VNR68_04135 [Sphingomicrobium sp.]|nr:hypothetical protein [Sphingomicrobium sp.]